MNNKINAKIPTDKLLELIEVPEGYKANIINNEVKIINNPENSIESEVRITCRIILKKHEVLSKETLKLMKEENDMANFEILMSKYLEKHNKNKD